MNPLSRRKKGSRSSVPEGWRGKASNANSDSGKCLARLGNEAERAKHSVKGAASTSYCCGQWQLRLWKQYRTGASEFSARGLEEGAGVVIHQLRPLAEGSRGSISKVLWVWCASYGSGRLRRSQEADDGRGVEGIRVVCQLPAMQRPAACWKPIKLQPMGLSATWQICLRTASPATCAAGAYNSGACGSFSIISAQNMPQKRLFQINAAE